MKRLLALCGIAVLAPVAVAAGTQSARPRALLTYSVAYGPGHAGGPGGGLCLARADGTHRVRLTRRNEDRAASWSPNGRSVVFARGKAGSPAVRILVANSRGRVIREVAPAGMNSDPAWAPDGSRIAYVVRSALSSQLVVATPAGRTVTEVPARGRVLSRPAWSPDSRRIAFAEELQAEAGSSRIVVVDADGSNRRVLIGQASDPAWAPDGSRIAYVAYASPVAETGDIAVANADGSGARTLMSTRASESRPAWSPNGRLIVFARGSSPADSAILAVPSAGGAERFLVRSRSYGALDPAWRPAALLPRARRPACR